jgi:hypothetical protein
MTPRRYFRFSLRSILVAVTLAGCWLGWERHVALGRANLRQVIETSGGRFFTGDHIPGPFPRKPPEPPSWVRRQLGDESVGLIFLPSGACDRGTVKYWFPEADLCPATASDDKESSAVQAERQ